jgi:hypothetical protein
VVGFDGTSSGSGDPHLLRALRYLESARSTRKAPAEPPQRVLRDICGEDGNRQLMEQLAL